MDPTLQLHELPLEERLRLALKASTPWFLSGSDALQVSSWNSLTGVTLTIAGRFRTLDGQDSPFSFASVPATDRTIVSTLRALGDGWLLNVTVFVSAAAPITGQTFVRLQIVRGLASSGIVLGTLAAGYVTAVQPLAWPGSGVKSSLEGQGALRSITGTNPAAGVESTETVPAGARWRLLLYINDFVTDATVSNRLPRLVLDDGASPEWIADAAEVQALSVTRNHHAGAGSTRLVVVGSQGVWHLPVDLRLLAAHRIRTLTTNLQAGDNWGAPQLLVEEWLEGAA